MFTGVPHILICDDEELLRWTIQTALTELGYRVTPTATGEEALAAFHEDMPDCVLLDIGLPDISGLEVLEAMRRESDPPPVLMLTAYNSAETAVRAMKLGAHDYLIKPFDVDELKLRIKKTVEDVGLRNQVAQLKAQVDRLTVFGDLVANDPSMEAVFEIARKVARTANARILITGESGTGKGQLAKAIHQASGLDADKFVSINCAAIPGELLESELMGYEKGAFTDARQKKLGLVQLAHGGTLFLDEIGDMPPLLQSKILKVIDEKTFTPVGGTRPQQVEFRLITATNKRLGEEVASGRFREDLFYRINVITIEMPPLRQRPEDVIPLAHHFMHLFNAELARDYQGLAPEVVRAFRAYDWPGNVRELRNIIERVMILEEAKTIKLAFLPEKLQRLASSGGGSLPAAAGASTTAFPSMDAVERAHILRALELTNQNVSRAADLLGISRHTVLRKLERYGRSRSADGKGGKDDDDGDVEDES